MLFVNFILDFCSQSGILGARRGGLPIYKYIGHYSNKREVGGVKVVGRGITPKGMTPGVPHGRCIH